MVDIAIATCATLPEPDVDEELLLQALRERGAHVRMLAWDGPEPLPSPSELVVVRSTWNYFRELERFLGWVEEASRITRLLNPASVIRDNCDKTYLRDLEARGLPIVPTMFFEPGAGLNLHEALRTNELGDSIIIKPTVSAGSFLTERFDVSSEASKAEAHLARLLSGRGAMVQPFMRSVEEYGERSLVWIDGEVTHAIRKSPRFAGGVESVSDAVPIADDERELALRVLSAFGQDLLYARIDMVRDEAPDKTLRLMELELIEPSLFLKQSPKALDRLATGVVERARRA